MKNIMADFSLLLATFRFCRFEFISFDQLSITLLSIFCSLFVLLTGKSFEISIIFRCQISVDLFLPSLYSGSVLK
jgi:hypothetical protein